MSDERWEYGSDFHWPTAEEIGPVFPSQSSRQNAKGEVFYGSGRAALLAVLVHGRSQRGWRRLFLPTYFCPEVLPAVEMSGIQIRYYPDHPLRKPAGLPQEKPTPQDVVLRVNYFGWRGTECVLSSSELGCDLIEDQTHDPLGAWAQESRADFCFASLRKTCPIPDGAILWSPHGLGLPQPHPPSQEHLSACNMKLGGMVLKQAYLGGAKIQKEDFRRLFMEGEGRFHKIEMTGMSPVSGSMLAALSQEGLRMCRLERFKRFRNIGAVLQRNWATPELPDGSAPFSIVLLFEDQARRDVVREQLIQRRVYPAVLWNLADHSDKESNEFSSRMLSFPCDFRYGEADLVRLSRILQTVL